ncbi:MAG: hypothetical protein K0S74_396 [Chlamydiales bacterium]|jgi:3-hydroxymyristoyl/3-hydroxydecanoyl-(acyl carrier protein) dehydratase|nr:hypothetical protein [Chlamydiales bacterium]
MGLSTIQLPFILEKTLIGNKARVKCYIPQELAFLDGHFPEHPILPGVVQIHWAIHYAKEFFNITPAVKEGNAIKFTNPILPDMIITLLIEHHIEKFMLYYTFTSDEMSFSSGRLTYIPSGRFHD